MSIDNEEAGKTSRKAEKMSKVFISYNWIKEMEKYYIEGDGTEEGEPSPLAIDVITDFVDDLSASGHFIVTDNYPSQMDTFEESEWDANNVLQIKSYRPL